MSLWRSPGKFPFWSAIIPQQNGSGSVAARTVTTVSIVPPAGEVWFVHIAFELNDWTANDTVCYTAAGYEHTRCQIGGSYGELIPHLEVWNILTNTNYAMLYFENAATAAKLFFYGYSGFKLSRPLWSSKRLGVAVTPFKRATDKPLPTEISALDKYKVELYDHSKGDYVLSLILEEDTPLAVDDKGFPVERMSAYVSVDDFMSKIYTPYTAGTLDLVKSGWKKYFDKWKAEGISI